MLGNLLAAEWLKVARRPMAWTLLGVFLFLTALQQTLWFLIVALQEGALSGGEVTFSVLSDAAIAQIKLQLSLPGVFGAMLGSVNSTGGILAIILAAGMLGGDYGWGTLRALLARAPSRGAFLLAKLLALQLALLVGVLVTLLVGVLLALVYGAILGLPQRLAPADLLLLPVGVLRALFVILPYTLIACASAAFGRSVLAGVGGGLMFLAVDVSAGSLNTIGAVDELVRSLVNLLLQPNINRLVVENSRLFGLDQTVLTTGLDLSLLPSQPQALLVTAVYCAIFGYSAYRSLSRADIGGAS